VGVTRSRAQASELVLLLAEAGAQPVELHCLEFVEPSSWGPADAALADLSSYDGVLFTSVNAVVRTLRRTGGWSAPGVCVAGVGPATVAALRSWGVEPDVVPRRFLSEGLLEALKQRGGLVGSRWLLPRAEVARDVLPEGLRAAGARVDVVAVYRTVAPSDPSPIRAALASGLDAITFASGSSVRHLRAAVADDGWPGVLDGVAVVTIGPITSASAREEGLVVGVEAPEASLAAMVAALSAHLGGAP
jgi:uroporphyrinogen-III synthase